MSQKKQLKELTIKDNFLFGAVMVDEENCRGLLERVLDMPIGRVQISKEKSIVYHPEYKGVRLDVYAEDENHTHYNVEMQVVKKQALGRRSRYYHSQIEMELLSSGRDYTELPDTYVIFICDFDPFGKGKYRYTFQNLCLEDKELSLKEGTTSIFLNTRGTNRAEVPEALVKFLEFVKADPEESMQDFDDSFIQQLQNAISRIKGSREMEERFMTLEELLKDERAEAKAEGIAVGKAEAILVLLNELGTVPTELTEKITNEKDLTVLKQYLLCAARAESIEQFMQEIQ
jgi:predicted transposase/invertase (TIGR01784 family)